MFRLVTANDAAKLADALGQQLVGARANPLLPTPVLVPQAGLQRWLQVHLAASRGVLANVGFTPPAQFAWSLLRAARPDLPAQSPFEVEVLRWHLHAMLGETLDGEALAPVRRYLGGDGDPLRRLTLSLELARAFERMQGYRRERLLQWQRGEAADDWQAELWRRLLPRVGATSRATLVDEWLRRFDPDYPHAASVAKPAPPGLPESLACFACAHVSPDVLRMLAVAGRHCDVDFYLPLPSMEYLGELPRTRAAVRARLGERNGENPLLVQLGGALTEFIELLFGYEHVQPDLEHALFDTELCRSSLLGRVRDDMLHHTLPDPAARVALPDDSLQLRVCHTPLREVQTLHDSLLAMFEDPRFDPPLQPREVAVMMPAVGAYQPAIEAVFGGNPAPRIPYNLGDVGAAATHPVVHLFLSLLDAPASRWEFDELLDVLAAPGVMRRFDLDADQRTQLARRLREAGVRWGADETARAECGGYREFSWAFGIDRVVAGFACGDADATLVGDTAPLAGVEGAAFAHLDAVLAITETWRHLGDLARRRQRADAWQQHMNAILDSLYQADPRDLAEARALERIRAALSSLAEHCDAATPAPELTWAEWRACLRDALGQADPQQQLFTGGVTFCGMVPLRVVPFRVIALLGMNDDAFPRHARGGLDPLLADRRAGQHETGDRDVRTDDRLLFLQLIAATRERLYLSWVGHDPHTNEVRPPSAVVGELIDLLKKHYLLAPTDAAATAARDAWLPRSEPLQPFDARLFQADAAHSYAANWLPAACTEVGQLTGPAPFVSTPLAAVEVPVSALLLDDLQRFFADPARGFLERALHMLLPRDDDNADTALEPLQPSAAWLRYELANRLLTEPAGDTARQQAVLRAQACLPPGQLADAALAIANTRAELLREARDVFTAGGPSLDPLVGTLELADGTRLSGRVDGVYAAGLLRATPGSLSGKRALRAWLDTLFAAALSGTPLRCRLLWIEKFKAQARDIDVLDAPTARAQLAEFVRAMRAGLVTPLSLFPQASWDALGRWRPQKGEADAAEFARAMRKAATQAEDASETHGRPDFAQAPVRMAWRGVDLAHPDPALAEQLYRCAQALFPELASLAKAPRP